MTLSVLVVTHQPAPLAAAVIAPLREVADEIVLAVDHRLDVAALGAYEELADRLLRFEYSGQDRGLAWLHERCSGDWVLTLAADEVPGAALVAALPELCADPEIRQYGFPMRWVWPDRDHWLDELPWSPDFHKRLVRNDDALWFEGRTHSGARGTGAVRFLEQPAYHLDLVLASEAERAQKVERYIAARPGLVAPGGGEHNERYYLPERHARLDPLPVPAEDRERIAALLDAPADFPARPLRGEAPVGLRADIEAVWAGRELEPEAYRAAIRPLGRDHRMHAGETRNVYVAVRNDGPVTWPGGEDGAPVIRLSYHWRDAGGATEIHDGHRSPFPAAVAPDQECIVPAVVTAPQSEGPFELVFDLVHEHVRWFGCDTPVPMPVDGPPRRRRWRS